MKKIFVSGANGFIGLNLCRVLVSQGFEVIAGYHSNGEFFQIAGIGQNVKKVKIDVTNFEQAEKIVSEESPHAVIHLAAQSMISKAQESSLKTFRTNISGTVNMLEASRNANVKLFILASSGKTYGQNKKGVVNEKDELNGLTPYAVSKAAADMITKMYSDTFGLKTVVLRLANIYGPMDFNPSRLVPSVCLKALNNEGPVLNNGGTAKRDFLFVDDLSKAFLLVLKNHNAFSQNEQFNISMGSQASVRDVAQMVLQLSGKNIELQLKDSHIKEEIEPVFSNEKAEKILGWKPEIPLEEGISKTLDWFEKNEELF